MNMKKTILVALLSCMKAVTQIEALEDANTEGLKGLKQFLRPDGVLLLTAGEDFGKTRVVATMIDGNVVLLDLNPSVGAINHHKINLLDPKDFKKSEQPKIIVSSVNPKRHKPEKNPYKPAFLQQGATMTKNTATESKTDSHSSANRSIGFNQMVQYGFRHFTGPSRLIGQQKAKVVPVSRIHTKQLVRIWHNRLSVRPLRQWKMGDKYLTILLVNNTSSVAVEFDPRALRGRLMFAAALYPVIQPKGSYQDQTLWAVVTDMPFNKAIR